MIPKMNKIWAKTDIKSFFCLPEGQKKASAKGRSPPQELEEGPRSGPHLVVHGNKRKSGSRRHKEKYMFESRSSITTRPDKSKFFCTSRNFLTEFFFAEVWA